MQENLNILPFLAEECYLRANPEERIGRAFLEFCREGDLQAVVGVIQSNPEVLLYQDPIGGMQSALHVAVAQNSLDLIWLLLFVATETNLQRFPAGIHGTAMCLNLERMTGLQIDIRSLKNSDGQTAADVASEYTTSRIDPSLLTGEGPV